MRVRWYIGALAFITFVSCSNEEDILPRQQEKIVSYLTGKHTPKLLSEQDAAESLDNDPPYYSTFGNTTYRYIADVYNPERLTRPEVSEGSRIDVTFSLYGFTADAAPREEDCVYSNDTTVINRLFEAGLNPRWSATSTGSRSSMSSISSCRARLRCRSGAGRRFPVCRRLLSGAASRTSWSFI